ncbi:MAG: T9SS type A sorting domain-containing protein, partial [Bacteroidetes bacterium]|nr:T9SS type A sorting domain-containing protein [Bacteroidota bacterium]
TANSNSNSSQCNFVKSLTNNAQVYSFCVCDKEFPYNTRFTKATNGNYLANVSTYDMLLITKHILGLQPFDDDFKYVAADANCSGTVTSADVSTIRLLIMGFNNNFGYVIPNNTSSGLIPSYKLFNFIPTASNFLVSTGEVNYQVPAATVSNNYYVVKTGDVSWNAATSPWNCLVGDNPDDRNQQVLDLSIPCLNVQRGQNVVVPIILNNAVTVSALQFELSFNSKQLRYYGFESGNLLSIGQESIGDFNVEDGKWRLGWFDPKGAYIKLPSNTILGYLKFTALDDHFTDCIKLSQEENALPGLLFDSNGNESTLRLTNTTVGHQSISVKVNPNPFSGETQVNVELSKSEKVKISILDDLGRIVSAFESSMVAGANQLTLSSSLFKDTAGIFFLKVQTASDTQTIKLIKQ